MRTEDARLLEIQKSYYDLRAPDYMDPSKPSDRPARGMLDVHQVRSVVDELRPTGEVLELACGPGAFTRFLASYASSVTAVDASARMLARNALEVADSKIRYVEADILSWHPDRTYDLVFFGHWLSHLPDTVLPSFLATVRSALKPGGRIAFVDEDDRHPEVDDIRDVGGVPVATRALADGSLYEIVKVFRSPDDLREQLRRLGWDVRIRRFGESHLVGTGSPLR